MTDTAYETVLHGRHQIGMVGAIRLERCADEGWNTRAGSSEYATSGLYAMFPPRSWPGLLNVRFPTNRVVTPSMRSAIVES
jgi:hypothetical protein